MKRVHLRALAFAGVALALFAAAGVASAEDGWRGDQYTITPGVFEAEGDGIAAAGGRLEIRICADEGILLTKGAVELGGDATYSDEIGWLGLHVYFDFHGCADVTGETWMTYGLNGGTRGRAAALAVGTGLTLRAEGIGIAFVKGEGTWADSNGEEGAWNEEGQIIKIGTIERPECPVGAQHDGAYEEPHCDTPVTAEPEPTPDEPQ